MSLQSEGQIKATPLVTAGVVYFEACTVVYEQIAELDTLEADGATAAETASHRRKIKTSREATTTCRVAFKSAYERVSADKLQDEVALLKAACVASIGTAESEERYYALEKAYTTINIVMNGWVR